MERCLDFPVACDRLKSLPGKGRDRSFKFLIRKLTSVHCEEIFCLYKISNNFSFGENKTYCRRVGHCNTPENQDKANNF